MGRYGGSPPIGDLPSRPPWQTLRARSVTIEPKRTKRRSKAEKSSRFMSCFPIGFKSRRSGGVEPGDQSDPCRQGWLVCIPFTAGSAADEAGERNRGGGSVRTSVRVGRRGLGNVEASPTYGCEPAMACKVVALGCKLSVRNGRIEQARTDQGAWLSWLERSLHTAEVGGSSPLAPTQCD
jgi:hypothetical protein